MTTTYVPPCESIKTRSDRMTDAVRIRQAIEFYVIRQHVNALFAAGYTLKIDYMVDEENEGGDPAPTFSTWDEIKPHLMACDEENLLCFKGDARTSSVKLVYGNDGPDVVADYGMSLEPIIGSLSEFDDPTDLIVAALLK